MTYLELINDVLVRLRETTVTTANLTSYSSLIGKFVNDAKRQVEDAYNWNVLDRTATVTTNASDYQYSLTNIGQRFKVNEVLNTTSNVTMQNIPVNLMNRYQNFTPIVQNIPTQYCFDGVDTNGDTVVTLFGRPNGVYTLKFFLNVPQTVLSSDTTAVLVPDVVVAQNAYARALIERGEDGGFDSSESFALYKSMLSDYIALEASRFVEAQEFIAV
jgi:hypothetical protein